MVSNIADTVIIMCGGDATRDGRFANFRPNTLGELGNITVFELILGELGSIGVRNAIIVVPDDRLEGGKPYAQEVLERYLSGRPRVQNDLMSAANPNQNLIDAAGPHDGGLENFIFVTQQKGKKGTGWGLGAALDAWEDLGAPSTLVVNADGIDYRADGGSDVRELAEDAEAQGAAMGLLTCNEKKLHKGTYKYGVVMRQPDGKVIEINEGPEHYEVAADVPEINMGFYYLKKSVITATRSYLKIPASQFGKPGRPGKLKQTEHRITDLVGMIVNPIEPNIPSGLVIGRIAAGVFVDCATRELRDEAVLKLPRELIYR